MHLEPGEILKNSHSMDIFLCQQGFQVVRLVELFIDYDKFFLYLLAHKVDTKDKTSELVFELHQKVNGKH